MKLALVTLFSALSFQFANAAAPKTESATFALGCFWAAQTEFSELRGVTKVVAGYSGGKVEKPSYEAVGTGKTGHAEAVDVDFNPGEISYKDLVTVFFTIHDPTTLNRQGNDVGSQYRSVIFHHTPQQRETATVVLAEQSAVWPSPVVTELLPAETFYPAEHYHQRYFELNPNQPYCAIVVEPKVRKARQLFAKLQR